jgi:peptidoglycan-associated lipoprotein
MSVNRHGGLTSAKVAGVRVARALAFRFQSQFPFFVAGVFMTIKQHLAYCVVFTAFAAALAGCSSAPKLSEPPARQASSGVQPQSGMPGGQTAGVNQDDLSGPPASVGRVVYFDFDSFVIKPQYRDLITQQARYLQSHHASHVTLEGNTDERGSREYNLALGQKRAEAVQHALVLEGASNDQIESVSFGAEKPADPGHDETAYAKNRRVEFRYH